MSELHEITSEASFQTHISSLPPSALLVLFFHTPWAAPCTQMRTVLQTLASLYKPTTPPSISFISVDAEELAEISEQYEVTAVPFVVLSRNNKIIENISGSNPIKVREAIEKHYQDPSSAGTTDKQSIPPPLEAVPRKIDETQQNDQIPQAPQPAGQGSNGASGRAAAPEASSKEELFARIGELVKAAPVMLFMKGTPSVPQCGFSRQLVAILRENSVKYGFFNILADDDVRQGLKEFADWPTFPQLWVRGELVGGLDIVKEEIEANPDFLRDYSVPKASSAVPT
ncbi:monothiol glutaredoxin [Trichophyton mentagrophytes]|uniref:Grx4 family monothiol glutaredoxin n=1 Tax=Trichophyton interdigitale (strain MR816) TaxID=1215338 RepID=A0A059J620_TRIIM|nr:Grx4 family monothiol glutaredoxin [Trichophyton interdigitale H6]KDB23219.1 Grx4 family monothiol glutaredoxin [Trichophyton interdigitale MR816]GBF63794.1 monothiol glutaredoxin [Trichophyton mentagrophytes]